MRSLLIATIQTLKAALITITTIIVAGRSGLLDTAQAIIVIQAAAQAISSEMFSTALQIITAVAVIATIPRSIQVAEVQAVAQAAPVLQEVAVALHL